jgi:hypothetical protein
MAKKAIKTREMTRQERIDWLAKNFEVLESRLVVNEVYRLEERDEIRVKDLRPTEVEWLINRVFAREIATDDEIGKARAEFKKSRQGTRLQ